MVAKSVIEIDVLDEKFQAFAAEFEKVKAATKDYAKDWAKTNDALKKSVTIYDQMLHALNSIAKSLDENYQSLEKHSDNLEKRQKNHNKALKDAAYTTGTIAKNMASMAFSAAKWMAFGAIGSGFGLGGLAGSASSMRRQAQGLGISTGQLRAANVNLGRYVDPAGVLGNIADVQADLSRRQILTRLGGREGQNPADMLATVMRSATQQFKAGGQTQQYAEAMGLTQIFSMEELRRLASLTEKEFNETIEKFQRDRQLLEVDDATNRAWQEFWIELKRSGNLIETSLIKGLVKLTPQLQELAETVAKAIEGFLKSDEVQKALQDFSAALKDPENKQAIQDFFEGIKLLAQGIAWVISKIPGFFSILKAGGIEARRQFGQVVSSTGDTPNASTGSFLPVGGALNEKQAYIASRLAGALNEIGVTNPRAIAGFLGSTQRESGFNPTIKNPESSAYGLFQLLTPRQREAAAAFGKPYANFSINEQIANTQRELLGSEQKALRALISARTEEEGAEAARQFYRYDTYMTDAQRRREMEKSLDYAKNIRVEVSSTAGSEINAAAKGFPR